MAKTKKKVMEKGEGKVVETREMEQGKVIGNVGILDIRNTTEESIARIKRVGNVGMLLCTPETAGFITRLNIGNMGNVVKAPADARVITGQVVFNRDAFKDQPAPLSLAVAGQVIVHPDVPSEDIEKGLRDLIISGQLICPERLQGVIQSKIRDLSGQVQIYTASPSAQLTLGTLALDETYLRSLNDDSEIVVIGKLHMLQVLPTKLLEQKIQRIQVLGRIVCHEENAETIFTRLDTKADSPKVTIIPAGFEFVEKPLLLDIVLLEALSVRKLYCTGRVQIDRDVDSDVLDRCIEGLVVKEILICPAVLKGVIARKCNILDTRAVFYEGELWLVEDELTLLPSRFDYLKGKATLVVFGELTVASDINPKVLVERLVRVHNLGTIRCTPEQIVAIQSLLGISEGGFEDSTQVKEASDEGDKTEEGIGNVGHLVL